MTPLGLQLYSKESPAQVFCCKYWEIFMNTYFEEHLRTVASIQNWHYRCQKENPTQAFFCEYCKNFQNTFFRRTPPAAFSAWNLLKWKQLSLQLPYFIFHGSWHIIYKLRQELLERLKQSKGLLQSELKVCRVQDDK